MMYVAICVTALASSFLTFFSGFGLGTILMPVFALFFDLPVAIGLTALVHLLNNLFKITLVFKNIHYDVLLRFGIPALIASFAGAWLLNTLGSTNFDILSYQVGPSFFTVNGQGLLVGALVFFFALVELIPAWNKINFSKRWALPGGLLTGFIGGLSGHQGALRSAFLLRLLPEKQAFIATGVAIACMVDVARISTYTYHYEIISSNIGILLAAVLSAFSGAWLGNKIFKKTSITFLKWMVGVFMLVISLLMMAGVINK